MLNKLTRYSLIMGLVGISLLVSSSLWANDGGWPANPKWQSKAHKATVVLYMERIDPDGVINERAFCSGSYVKDDDGRWVYTAAHCCEPVLGKSIVIKDYDGNKHMSKEITMDNFDTKGMDVCRVPINHRPRHVLKTGAVKEYWRNPGSGVQRDIRLYISSHFPRYCTIHDPDYPRHATDWCFQRAYLISYYDLDCTRVIFNSFKGIGGGMSGSPVLDHRGKIIGVLSVGWRIPEMEKLGGYAPIDRTVWYHD